MNTLQRSLVEKAGYDNGFEHVVSATAEEVRLASARHRAQVQITAQAGGFALHFEPATAALLPELQRSFPVWADGASGVFCLSAWEDMAALLRRAAQLSQALPNQAMRDFHAQLAQAMPLAERRDTEVQRLVRQRVGQDCFRRALLDYWGGACAVTGVAVTQVLRASHAKPWAECADDAERLDAFNGFLLVANLDALFDRFLISFSDTGHLLISPHLPQQDVQRLGLTPEMRLRWLADGHRPYLQWHRERFAMGVG